MINAKDLDRLLKDSRESTLNEIDELSFIRLVLRMMANGFSYQESLEACYVQLSDINSGE